MKIYLVRHGQSEWQIGTTLNLDGSLTDTGHKQSKKLAEWLAKNSFLSGKERVKIKSLHVSPLVRAQETAGYISHSVNLPIITQQNLCEAPFRTANYLPRHHSPSLNYSSFVLDPIYREFKQQADQAFDELVNEAEISGGSILVVSHGGLIKTMLRLVINSDLVCFRLYNAAINLLEWKQGRWHLVHINFWDYLPIELRTF